MKKIKVVYVIIIVLTVCITSCKKDVNKVKEKIDYTVISGTIDSTANGELILSSLNGFRKAIQIKDNQFLDTLRIDDGVYTIAYPSSRASIFIAQGGQLSLKANGNDYANTVKYSGDHSGINNYYIKQSNLQIDFFKKSGIHFAKEENEFLAVVEAWKNKNLAALDTVKGFSTQLKETEKKHIKYGSIYMKQVYANNHAYYAKKEKFTASESLRKELDEVLLNDETSFFYSENYKRLITDIINNKAAKLVTKDSISFEIAKLRTVVQNIKNEKMKNSILLEDIQFGLSLSKNKKKYYQEFIENSTNQSDKDKITELFAEVVKLDKGKPSPTFNKYENHDGTKSSLSDFRGKYVYIDVWATWCGPCKYELPFLKEIEKEYHDKNIEFISISVDIEKNYEKWKKMVTDQDMKGIQLISDKDFNSDFIKAYKIKGIPQFIFLDPDGNIIESNAPRPSDKKLIELFNEYAI